MKCCSRTKNDTLGKLLLGVVVTALWVTASQGALADRWNSANDPRNFREVFDYFDHSEHRIEGLLNAIAHNDSPSVENQLFVATEAVFDAVDVLNDMMVDVYPSLSEDEQIAVEDAYEETMSNLELLLDEANQLFNQNVFVVIDVVPPDDVQTRIPLRSFGTAGST